MPGRTTPKGTRPARRRAAVRKIAGHYPVPGGAPAGIDAPGMKWRRCTCGILFGGSDADNSLRLHCRYGPEPEVDAPCCQRWEVADPDGWRTVRSCDAECDHDHEHHG